MREERLPAGQEPHVGPTRDGDQVDRDRRQDDETGQRRPRGPERRDQVRRERRAGEHPLERRQALRGKAKESDRSEDRETHRDPRPDAAARVATGHERVDPEGGQDGQAEARHPHEADRLAEQSSPRQLVVELEQRRADPERENEVEDPRHGIEEGDAERGELRERAGGDQRRDEQQRILDRASEDGSLPEVLPLEPPQHRGLDEPEAAAAQGLARHLDGRNELHGGDERGQHQTQDDRQDDRCGPRHAPRHELPHDAQDDELIDEEHGLREAGKKRQGEHEAQGDARRQPGARTMRSQHSIAAGSQA